MCPEGESWREGHSLRHRPDSHEHLNTMLVVQERRMAVPGLQCALLLLVNPAVQDVAHSGKLMVKLE